jgi:hypothetical protein
MLLSRIVIFKGMTGALAPFSYLVFNTTLCKLDRLLNFGKKAASNNYQLILIAQRSKSVRKINQVFVLKLCINWAGSV